MRSSNGDIAFALRDESSLVPGMRRTEFEEASFRSGSCGADTRDAIEAVREMLRQLGASYRVRRSRQLLR